MPCAPWRRRNRPKAPPARGAGLRAACGSRGEGAAVRILLAPVGTRGDVQPMLALALGLRARGHVVTFCAPPNFESWLAPLGFAFWSSGLDFQAFVHEIGTRVHRALPVLRQQIRVQFEAMAPLAADADVIVGASVHCAGLSLGQKLGIPYAYALFSPSLLPSGGHPSPTCPWQRLPRWLNRATWAANGWLWNRLFRRALNGARAGLGLGPVRDTWGHILSAPLLLAVEPALARPPADSSFRGVQTGAWFLPEPEPLGPEIESFLAAGPPPVFVGFGSMTDRRPDSTTGLIVKAARAAGQRVILGRGAAGLGAAAGDEAVHIVDQVPHAQLFPRVAAVVHHGGAGTTAAAARAGVPQVIVPHLLDQFFWGERIRVLGLGPAPIPRPRLGARRLARALVACVGDIEMRTRARTFAAGMVQDGVARGIAAVETLASGA